VSAAAAFQASKQATVVLTNPGRCRVCGDPAWLADATGPVHPCCLLWAEREPGAPCRSCEGSKAHGRGWRR
jgi:hypothetical protein